MKRFLEIAALLGGVAVCYFPSLQPLMGKSVAVPVGAVALFSIAILLILWNVFGLEKSVKRLEDRAEQTTPQTSSPGTPAPQRSALEPELAEEVVEFQDQGVWYLVKYRPDKSDVIDWAYPGAPRCLKHRDKMHERGSRYGFDFRFECAACHHKLSWADHEKLTTLAKAELEARKGSKRLAKKP